MATGKARKSTSSKKKVTSAIRSKLSKKTVEIDQTKSYVVDKFGPIHLSWGKRRVKNKKGKFVKKYYLKDSRKHLIWIKWRDVFEDSKATGEFDSCAWSAEPQENFDDEIAKDVLATKICWPWPTTGDENFEDRRAILISKGYKEWHQTGVKKSKKQNWMIQDAIEPVTGSSEGESEKEDESSSTGADDAEEEEEDDV